MSVGGTGSPLPLAVGGFSRGEIREEIAKVFGFHAGTATGAGDFAPLPCAILDANLTRWPIDYWIGANVWIEETPDGSAPEGETAWVTDSTTTKLTVLPTFTVVVPSAATYHLFQVVSKAAIDEAVARACAGGMATYRLNESSTTSDYDLTHIIGLADARQLRSVWVRPDSDVLTMPYKLTGWQVEENFGQLTLRLPTTFSSGDDLWIEYQLDQTGMADDGLHCSLPIALIKARAVVHLMQNLLVAQNAGGVDKYGQLLRYWNEQLAKEERKWQPHPGATKRYHWLGALQASDRAAKALGIEDKYV